MLKDSFFDQETFSSFAVHCASVNVLVLDSSLLMPNSI